MPRRVSTFVLIGDGQFVAIIGGVVLYQRIDHGAVGGEIGNHVGLCYNELSVQDVIVGVIATVDDKRRIHHKSGGVALAVGAGIGFIGWHPVKGKELRVALPINDDASAGAFHVGSNVDPSAHRIQIMILHRVRVNRNRGGENGPVGILGVFLAPMHQGQERY